MSGNVWEWCQDWYDADYYKNSPANNPTGPTSGAYRVLRGGSWGSLRSTAGRLTAATTPSDSLQQLRLPPCMCPIVLAVTLIWFVRLS
jgi:formylglycine-generating enzyme required for sulfatase activity